MDNSNTIPEMPIPPAGSSTPASTSTSAAPSNMPMLQQVQAPVEKKKDVGGLIKIIVIIFLSLLSLTFIGLFIWMTIQYNDARTDVDGQISVAVAAAKDEQASKLEAEFLEREKYPYKTFSGPVDYGQLTFEYPRTWSVYVAKAATSGGDFSAYFNPNQVDEIGKDSINALNVTIVNRNFEDVTAEYQRYVDRSDSELTMQAVTFNNANGNRYTGVIPNTDLRGIIIIFKIRDKTAILQTDSMLFEADFNKLVETITFNA